MPVLLALRRGPAGCEFKDSQLRHRGPASEMREEGRHDIGFWVLLNISGYFSKGGGQFDLCQI